MSVAQQRRGKNPVKSKASPARLAALETLRLWREREGFVQDIMARTVDDAPLSPQDRAFATRLVCGVVSCAGTLNEVLNSCLNSPRDVKPKVRDALLISTYEILFLQKDAHAAVDQGVELVRSIAPRAAGLANAVLRKVVNARESFPFGNPLTDAAAFARSQGFPLWLAEKLTDVLGADDARAFMEASNEPAPLFVAVNAAKTSDDEMLALLNEAAAEAEPVEVEGETVPGCFLLRNRRALLEPAVAEALRDGRLLVADAASQAVAQRVARAACEARDAKGEPFSFLEVGAGRGTKTILLQSDAMRLSSEQFADYTTIDNHEFKTGLGKGRAETYGIHVTEALTGDATNLAAATDGKTFDRIFIDSPCTGLGTLRRHPEIRWRVTPHNIEEAAALDDRLLASAAASLSEHGILAYATCTITPEENQGAIGRFLDSPVGKGFSIKETFRTQLIPGDTSPDAHFLTVLARR